MLGWSREKIRNYKLLESICFQAWDIIGTTFDNKCDINNKENVPSNGTNVTTTIFTEGLLRSILSLRSPQQLELVKELADNNI